MAKLLYSATMPLDGFIAGAGGDMSWLTAHLGPNPVVGELIGQIGAPLVGHHTSRGDDSQKSRCKSRPIARPTHLTNCDVSSRHPSERSARKPKNSFRSCA
jgi:hypothetical protein